MSDRTAGNDESSPLPAKLVRRARVNRGAAVRAGERRHNSADPAAAGGLPPALARPARAG